MAKTKAATKAPARKPIRKSKPEEELTKREALQDPEAIHKLLGIYGPYEPPEPPIATKGYVTFWDPANLNCQPCF